NLTIEAGARAGLVAPDETTFGYLAGRRFAPRGADWDTAVERWRELRSDADAQFDRAVNIDASVIAPQVTWGTSPGMVCGVDGRVPNPLDAATEADAQSAVRALVYMGLTAGTAMADIPVDVVFIGSCTNSRI